MDIVNSQEDKIVYSIYRLQGISYFKLYIFKKGFVIIVKIQAIWHYM